MRQQFMSLELVVLVVFCWSVFLTAVWLITADPHRGGSISCMPCAPGNAGLPFFMAAVCPLLAISLLAIAARQRRALL